MMKIYIFTIIAFILVSTPVFAHTLFDDFSGDILNITKWNVSRDNSGTGGDLPSEYYLDAVNDTYHTAQTTATERGIILTLNHTFQPGETLDYDITYFSGSGNHLSRIFINDNPFRPNGDFSIGYWNEPYPYQSGWGNLTNSIVHVKVEFLPTNIVRTTFTNYSGGTYIRNMTIIGPYTIGVNSRTGDNGLFHFDYDNFMINFVPLSVNLMLPLNNSFSNSSVQLQYNAISYHSDIISCTSIADHSSQDIIDLRNVNNDTNTIINLGLNASGNWIISLNCDDGESRDIENVTITVDYDPPQFGNILPNTQTTLNHKDVNFEYNVTDNYGIKSCNLYINNELNLTNSTEVSQIVTNTFLQNLSEGTYNWFTGCEDLVGNSVNSSNNVLTIDTTPPTITSSNPSNGASLSPGTTSVVLELNTSGTATCRLSDNYLEWNNMTAMNFTSSSAHYYTINNLVSGTNYNYHFLCEDLVNNRMLDIFNLSFSVAQQSNSGSGGGGGGGGGSSSSSNGPSINPLNPIPEEVTSSSIPQNTEEEQTETTAQSISETSENEGSENQESTNAITGAAVVETGETKSYIRRFFSYLWGLIIRLFT